VRLTAYSSRSTPTLDAEVIRVSADRMVDQHTGQPYFDARVAIDPAALEQLPDVQLQPGMPADVMIVTGRRTALEYVVNPLTNSLNRAFREE
jgi:multidrug efflux pump subunit AcrA (membrane-fusion protein)